MSSMSTMPGGRLGEEDKEEEEGEGEEEEEDFK